VSDKVCFGELTADMIGQQVVDDINVLLPQLSTSAKPVTTSWLYEVVGSGTRIFVAWSGEHIVGTVLLSPMKILVGQKDWIEDVVVDHHYRGQGIMGRLMDMAEEVSRNRAAKSVNLTSNPERGPARAGYTKRGYELRNTGVYRLTHKR
jgi:GNAT superfamily N-acetyltransferase